MKFSSPKHQKGVFTLGLIAALGVLFIVFWWFSTKGFGYMGYRPYAQGPSMLYWGEPNWHENPSLRNGSTGGPSNRGGGHGSGK